MPSLAMRVDNLSKRYRIGAPQERYYTLRDTLTRALSAPFRRLRWHVPMLQRANVPTSERSNESHIWALKDVCFEVKCGEVVGIIGRNGAGKSTLLKILSRITEPTDGYAEVHGRVGSLLEVGTGFHPELTGRENIYLSGAILGMKKAELDRKFDEIVAFAEVEKFIDTPVKRYSSGMYVRLAFAVAAHLEPDLLLVDEVLAVGDAEFQKKCLGRMGEVGREGRTVLLISHSMHSIVNLCQRAILLDAGKLATDGPALEVVETYLAAARVASSEAVWPDPAAAPGGEKMRWHSIRILSETGEPASELDIAGEIIIQFNYWCLQEGSKLTPAFQLWRQNGIAVLESYSAPMVSLTPDYWYDCPHPVGLYQSECRIPANFLNDGIYTVSIGIMGSPECQVDEAVSFHVYDSGQMFKHNSWMGVVRPRLAWNTRCLSADSAIVTIPQTARVL